MCGITGIVDAAGGVDGATIVRMRDTLTHRGPDDAGVYVSPDGTAGLGHRRLSVLDLSVLGHQPMSDPAGRVWVVYNGEVYNFRDLRQELRGLGFAFRSDTDTEVIVNGYLAWGVGLVERLEGMFAFAVYDAAGRVCRLVRDRLGIKPLVYWQSGGRLVFGSEIRAVLAAGCVDRQLSPQAAYDYFSYGYVPTPDTIYKSIRKLPPAHVLTFQDGRADIECYWRPKFECLGDDSATAGKKLAELIDRSVEDYLVSDVPTGVYLSGGLDSSVVTQRAAAVFRQGEGRRLGGGGLHTFSIGFDVREHSELPYARAAADQYGTEHFEQVVTRDMAHDEGKFIIDLFDEPFAASSAIPMTFLARLARQKVTVALCGEGGDEAFGGYSWYRWWQEFRRPGFWRTAAGRGVRRVIESITRHRKRKWWLPSLEQVDLYAQLMGALTRGDKQRIFSPDLVSHLAGRDEAGFFRRHWRADLPAMARMQYLDMMTFLPDLNLARADRTSMHVALELRVPLLNHRLVEYACGLAQDVRNPGGRLKGLFRQAVGDRLPEAIRDRKKKGFSAPVKEWFEPENLVSLVRDVRAERGDLAGSWLNKDLEDFAARLNGSRAYKLWVFLNWIRRHA
jgi:asparagine synthase (glutamine-hydrolysing)